jgi:PAS domain S-box-containing protein
MNDWKKSKEQLIAELVELRQQVADDSGLRERHCATALLQVVPLGIHQCDTQGRINFVNPSQEAITGYTADELVGTFVWDRMPLGPERDFLPEYFRYLVTEQPAPTPYFAVNVRKDGEVFDVRVDWNYLRNSKGELTGFVSIVTDVTVEQRSQAALQVSEERYRSLTETTTDVIYILDRSGKLLFVNRAAASYFRVSPEALVGKTQQDLFPPEKVQEHMECLRRVFETGEIQEDESWYRFGPHEVWLNVRTTPLRDEQGNITSAMGVCRDITPQKRVELALRSSEAKYRRLHQSMWDAFVSVDMTGRILECNDAYCQMLGYEQEELLKLTYMDLTPDRWHAFEARIIDEEILPLGHSPVYEKEYRRKDGTVLPVELRTNLIRDDDGQPATMWAIVRDITERKRAQKELFEANRRLEQRVDQRTAELTQANTLLKTENQQRRQAEEELTIFRRFVEAATQGFGMADVEGRIVYVNPFLARLYGKNNPDEVIGTHVSALYPPDYLQRREREILPALRRGQHWQGEQWMAFSDGQFHPTIHSIFPVCDDDGRLLRTAAIITDITELKKSEAKLKAEQQALRRMLLASDHERRLVTYELHDGVAQQLMGALMHFQCPPSVKGRDSRADDAYRAGMDALRQASSELRRVMNRLRTPVLDKFGLCEAIEDVAAQLRSIPGSPHIEYHYDRQLPRLESTLENSLFRIAQEAMTNACRHSRSEKIRVALVQKGGEVTLEVRDWGTGFDVNNVRENRFGLEGIRERCRILGGRLNLQSQTGEGTVVQVTFPILEAAAGPG